MGIINAGQLAVYDDIELEHKKCIEDVIFNRRDDSTDILVDIAKNYLGQPYMPEWNFNGMGDMIPGQGYHLKVNNVDVLQYLSNDDFY